MEQLPNSSQAEQRLLTDISHYCRQAHEAEGSYTGALYAVADFLVRQFGFTYQDAASFVKGSDFFAESDTGDSISGKLALAPLLLTDDLIELQAVLQIGFHEGDQTDSLNVWYSNMASNALSIAGPYGHSIEDCCADSPLNAKWQDEMACVASDHCAFRVTRQFLLGPALQPNLAAISDDADILLQHIILESKLAAAVDCEFITVEQKNALDAVYESDIDKNKPQ